MEEKFYWTPEEVHNYYSNLKQGETLVLPNDAYCTKNFTWNEVLRTSDSFFKTPPSEEILNNLKSTADVLQVYRDKIGKPIIITSSLRTKEEQKAIQEKELEKKRNGKPYSMPSDTSLHLEGLAMDFVVSGADLKNVQNYLNRVHVGEVEFGNNYTHISLPTFSKKYLKNNGLSVDKFFGKLILKGISMDNDELKKVKTYITKRINQNWNTLPNHFNSEENSELFKDKNIHFIKVPETRTLFKIDKRLFSKEEINRMSKNELTKFRGNIERQKLTFGFFTEKEAQEHIHYGKLIYVNAYIRRDGTKVRGYFRTMT